MKKVCLVIKNKSLNKKERLLILLKSLLKENFKYEVIDEVTTVVTLNSDSELTTINASFLAMKEDFDSEVKILILPCLNKKLFSYVDSLKEGEIKNLFELTDEKRNLYKEMSFLVDEFDIEILKTIKCYIEENKSPLLASLRLYCHRNTVSYRVKVFEKKTRISLDSFYNYIFVYYLIKYKLEGESND